MAVVQHALTQRSKGQGHTVMKTVVEATNVLSTAVAVCCCCPHGTAHHM